MDTMNTSNPIKALSLGSYNQTPFAAIRSRSQIMASAYNEFRDIVAIAARAHCDQTLSACQAMFKANSMKDAVSIQTNYIREYTQTSLTRSGDLIQASYRLAHVAMTSMTIEPTDAARADA